MNILFTLKIKLNSLIFPKASGLTYFMASAHFESPREKCGREHTIRFSGAQLTGVSPAFSLQGTAAFLLGVISGLG